MPNFLRREDLVVVDRDGQLISPLPHARLDSVTWELNAPGQIVYTLPQNCPEIMVPAIDINEVQLRVNGIIKHWGIHYQEKQAPDNVQFTCPGLLQYMQHRFVTNTSLEYAQKINPVNTATWVPIDQMDIGAGIWKAKNDQLNIKVGGYDPSGVMRLRIYEQAAHQNILKDILSEFPQLSDDVGTPTGFDFDIDIGHAPRRFFQMYFPKKGVRQFLQLEWGKNIIDYDNSVDGSTLCNSVYFTGEANGSNKTENYYADPSTDYIPFEDVRSRSGESDAGVLKELAQRWTAEHRQPLQYQSLKVVEISDKLLGLFSTGDEVYVNIQNGRTNIAAWQRIQKIEWTPGSGELALSMVQKQSLAQ